MKRIISLLSVLGLLTVFIPCKTFAAAGIFASGGGDKTVGQSFTITVTASGADFDSLQGTISISGPVDVQSFTAGGATWLPGKTPSNGGQFVGITSATNSLTVATIKLKGKSAGSGSVSVGGVKLARNGTVTGTGAGGANFSIEKAPDLPGAVKVSSSSHPDQNAAYEATTVVLTWDKAAGVDNFSYLLDQSDKTTPAAKATDANTSATFTDKAIGTYYFHIRAHKPDGWGSTAHFKINIKEPDAKINESLAKPSDIKIDKSAEFTNNITDGTVTGLKITGKTEAGYTASITLTPAPALPEGKTMSVIADESGDFELILDFPIAAGFHKLTIQGQKEKVLTPLSDEITFEISQRNGGAINMLTDADAEQPVVEEVKSATDTAKAKNGFSINKEVIFYSLISIFVIIILVITLLYTRRKRLEDKELSKIIKKTR